jgi:hypothetical protein
MVRLTVDGRKASVQLPGHPTNFPQLKTHLQTSLGEGIWCSSVDSDGKCVEIDDTEYISSMGADGERV